MFWRSVVFKLWITFLIVIFVVLAIISFFLLEFFESYHVKQAEEELLETANKISSILYEYQDQDLIVEMVGTIKDPESRIIIFNDQTNSWTSDSDDEFLPILTTEWLLEREDLSTVWDNNTDVMKQITLADGNQILMVGTGLNDQVGAVFAYQSRKVVAATTEQTTRIILLAAAIATILMTIFAFFLSSRITAPLIKMREAASGLAKGEFHTKVPILTHDEIGELAMAFNRMGRQLNYHIDALSQEKEQLYSILRSMADGVITLNRVADIIVSNPPAKKFLEDWRYELNIENEDTLPNEVKDLMQEVIQIESESMREVFIQGRNWVMIMSPLYDQTKVRGVVAVIRDMTDERKMDKLREEFIANVSHELRTPISMLQGYSEAIVDDIAESKEEKNELAYIIRDESLRMGRLVNELLDLARIKAGQIQLNQESIEVNLYVDRIVRKFKGLADEKEISLHYVINNKKVLLSFDPDRMEQVLTNLIDNAIHHTQEQGEIVVGVEEQIKNVRFYIKDNGSGIPQEDIPFVFERFYKADKSRQRKEGKKGTGLGLAIAKNIVEAHRGNISVQSKHSEGTTFSFEIPKNENNTSDR